MKKIQVTTAEIKAPAQIILPNTYFVSKAVKAQLSVEQLRSEVEALKNMGQKLDSEVLVPGVVLNDVVEMAGTFLNELIDALEGEDPENNSSSSQGV